MQLHAKPNQAEVKLNLQKELLVKQLEPEMRLKSCWSPQPKRTTFSTRVVCEACFGSFIVPVIAVWFDYFCFTRKLGKSATWGKGTQSYLQLTSKSNIQVLHVLAQLHLHVSSLFVHDSIYILTKCIVIKLAKQLSQLCVTCRLRFNHCQEQLLNFKYRSKMKISPISSSRQIQL